MRAGRNARRTQVLTLRAFFRDRCSLGALAVALFAGVQRLVVDVGDEAKAGMIIGVVQNQAVRLALGRAKATTDDLDEQAFAFGRAA